MRRTLTLLTLCGCGSRDRAGCVPTGAPAVVDINCRREHDPTFSRHEQDLVAAARHHLEQSDKRVIDAYYRIRKTVEGYEVYVRYVTGYEDREPIFIPCGHYKVVLRDDETVIRVLSGPSV